MATDNQKSLGDNSQMLMRRIKDACSNSFGVLESRFLCQSLSVLEPRKPLTVSEDASVESVLRLLQSNKTGCVVVLDEKGAIGGIFTERDCLLKIALSSIDVTKTPIRSVMTSEPVCEQADTTIAYALNLMSIGGFRHIPIIDSDRRPIGMISVKDVVDYLVGRMTEDLLAFATAE